MMNTLRILAALTLLGALQAPVHAQLPEPPEINPSQILSPDRLEFAPTPGTVRSLLFGDQVVRHDNTALITEAVYPNAAGDEVGRVAVFTRNGQGTWVRSASIDAPSGNLLFGQQLAVFNSFALIESNEHAFLYQRVDGKWKRIQLLTPPSGYRFQDMALWNNWAFIGATSATAGAVYVYQFTTGGTLPLRGVQTLRSYSGDPGDLFGKHVVISNARVLVSAEGDRGGRGAAYVYELSGSLFVKRQKLIAINGATTDRFARSVGISGDWMAIGAPGVVGPRDSNCPGGGNSGAIYVFQRVNGTWLQQDALLAGDPRSPQFSCLSELGRSVSISGTWLTATLLLFSEPGDFPQPIVYKRDTTGFTPRAFAPIGAGGEIDQYLSNGLLLVGRGAERGCNFEFCPGNVFVYDLEKAGL